MSYFVDLVVEITELFRRLNGQNNYEVCSFVDLVVEITEVDRIEERVVEVNYSATLLRK